jgi:hypothetical protein
MPYLFLYPLTLILAIMACESTAKKSDFKAVIQSASIYDTLPNIITENESFEEIQGYRIQQAINRATYYFEYRTDHQTLLHKMAMLPFPIDSIRADVQVQRITEPTMISNIEKRLINNQLKHRFTLPESLVNFDVYTCLKSPQQHILLLSKSSNRVIHIIEYV